MDVDAGSNAAEKQIAPVLAVRIERPRQPDADGRIRIPKAARHHADDCTRHVVER